MDRPNHTELMECYEHVIGRESRAWEKWWVRASRDSEHLYTALVAALLSLGKPPHPAFLTQDLTDIVLSCAPPRYPDQRHWVRWKNVVDAQYRRQVPYNQQLNAFAQEHGLVFTHKNHDPAQFRKLFAAFLDLHACKVKEATRAIRPDR